MRQLLDHAAENGYGIPAFNASNMEQIMAIMAAAAKTDSPVILQASTSALKYATPVMFKHMVQAAVQLYPQIPVSWHLDHGPSPMVCFSALYSGFTSVMMDGSLEADGKTPASHEYNARVSKEVSAVAHAMGASVEGEIGVMGSLETGRGDKEDGHGHEGVLGKDKLLTNPDEAVKFALETKVDALAVAIGTSHGAYKFTRKPDGAILSIDTIKKIHEKLPSTHIVMHGSSSVPQEIQDIINANGGNIKQTYGVPIEEIQEGIKHGVRKVNVDTDLRMALTAALRKYFTDKPADFDVRKYLGYGMEFTQKECTNRYEAFGAAGHASSIKPITLADMAKRYASGELDPKAG
jgi:fructose-bisphosphate aldolase class II